MGADLLLISTFFFTVVRDCCRVAFSIVHPVHTVCRHSCLVSDRRTSCSMTRCSVYKADESKYVCTIHKKKDLFFQKEAGNNKGNMIESNYIATAMTYP
jgi:hypothetical protein